METLLKDLKTAIFSSMERMFFLLADPEEETNTKLIGEISVHLGITGKPSYLLTVTAGSCLGDRMLSDLLGSDRSGDDREMMVKCLQETVNVIAGRFILVLDNTSERNLTLPTVDKASVFPGHRFESQGELIMSFDGCGMKVSLESEIG